MYVLDGVIILEKHLWMNRAFLKVTKYWYATLKVNEFKVSQNK